MSAAPSAAERRVVEEIGRRHAELTDLLAMLVAFDTRVPDPDLAPRDEAALQAYVAQRLRAAGLEVDVWEPDRAALPANRYPIPAAHHFRGRPQLLARAAGAGGGRGLLLNGHIDVVGDEPRELWTSDAFAPAVRDGRLYGRGACDMKGGVAAMVFATETLRALQVPLAGDLVVNTVTDEESTAAGSLASVARGIRADGGIIPEPTSLTAWLGARGSLTPVITVRGRAGHAAHPIEPAGDDGGPVNAIEKLRPVLDALAELRDEWQGRASIRHRWLRPGTVVPTAVRSGQWVVSYPAEAELRLHVQYLPGQADADGCGTLVEREIEEHVLAATRADPWLAEHPPRFLWDGDVPPAFHEPDEPICAFALDTLEALGLPREIASGTTWFDGPTFSRAGIPTIALGPGDIRMAHAVDECVALDELVRAAQVIAVAAMRFCGPAEG